MKAPLEPRFVSLLLFGIGSIGTATSQVKEHPGPEMIEQVQHLYGNQRGGSYRATCSRRVRR